MNNAKAPKPPEPSGPPRTKRRMPRGMRTALIVASAGLIAAGFMALAEYGLAVEP